MTFIASRLGYCTPMKFLHGEISWSVFTATKFPVFGTLLPLVIEHVVQLNKSFTILHAVFMSSGSSEMDGMSFASSALRLTSNVSLMWKCRDTPSTPSTLPDPVLAAVIFQVFVVPMATRI